MCRPTWRGGTWRTTGTPDRGGGKCRTKRWRTVAELRTRRPPVKKDLRGCGGSREMSDQKHVFRSTSLLRTALKDRPQGPPTANRQPPSIANRQPPPTTNRQPLPTATSRQPPTTNPHQPPITNHQPPPTATKANALVTSLANPVSHGSVRLETRARETWAAPIAPPHSPRSAIGEPSMPSVSA